MNLTNYPKNSIFKIKKMETISKLLISLGALFIIMGIFTYAFGGLFSWFGKLPGDIRIQGENYFIYAPITSMILLSLVLNLIFYLFNSFIK
jgi:uncharacterized protein HemY